MEQTANQRIENADYGLRRGILSPMETLAQSVSTMAPTTTPAATIPLVCALAGNGTWLAYATGDRSRVPCCLMHRALRSPFSLARIALYLRIDDSASMAHCNRRLEPFVGLCSHRIERDRRVLSLRKLASP